MEEPKSETVSGPVSKDRVDVIAAMMAIKALLPDLLASFTTQVIEKATPGVDPETVLSWIDSGFIEALYHGKDCLSFRFTKLTLESICNTSGIAVPEISSISFRLVNKMATRTLLSAISYLGGVDVSLNDACVLMGTKVSTMHNTKNRAVSNGYLTRSQTTSVQLLSITDAGRQYIYPASQSDKLSALKLDASIAVPSPDSDAILPEPGNISVNPCGMRKRKPNKSKFARTSHEDSIAKAIFVRGINDVSIPNIVEESGVSLAGACEIIERLRENGDVIRNGSRYEKGMLCSLTTKGIDRAKIAIRKEYVKIGEMNWGGIDITNTKECADWKLKSPVRFALKLLKDATVMVTLSERLADATTEQEVIEIESKIQQLGPQMQFDLFSMMIARHNTVARFEEQATALIAAKESRSDDK